MSSRRWMKSGLAAWLLLFSFYTATAHAADPKNWIVYYSDAEPAASFLNYDLIAFDRDNHPPLRELQNQNRILLGYVSFGEAETYRDDFKTIKALGVLLEKNPVWPDHYIIDVRNPKWAKYVIETIIPSIMRRGFDGIMVDTLDSVEYLEEMHPKQYAGMTEAAVNLVKAVHAHYPELKIMINRGFNTLPKIATDIDYVLAESIMSEDLPKNKGHRLFPAEVYQDYVGRLKALKEQSPRLQIVTVDYWNMKDKAGVKHIYDTQRVQGFIPYVTTIALDRADHEPK